MNSNDDRAILLALFDAAVDAIIVSDHTGSILRLNTAAAELFGYGIEALKGLNVSTLIPGDMAARHDGFMTRHIETGENRIIGISREVDGLRADGTVFPLRLSVGKTRIGAETAFVAILHDLTRKRIAEEQAARSQRMDAIGQMTGGIAHDFNNLLTVIIGNLELLEMRDGNEQNRILISDALEAAEMGADLTSRLMVFSRQSSIETEPVAINEVVEHSLALLKRAIGAHIQFDTVLAPNLWQTHTDATQLQTAILNLALNAQDAMPHGGTLMFETRNIVVDDTYTTQDTDAEKGQYVRLSVSDTGEGMTQQVRIRAFEPFFTTKPIGKGTGLGLSMVYGFVRQSGGHMAIHSKIGQGTTICLYFPATLGNSAEGTPSSLADGQYEGFCAGQLILLVEDDPRVMRSSKAHIIALGFECITANTGDAAWAILQEREDIALVFTDLVMPGTMSGHDLARKITLHKPGIRVLLTSGFSENVLRGGRIDAEFAILRKPFHQSELAAAIQAVFAGG